ncbi:hypothetical protein MYX65_03285 [Acidobacteria bacterium AH-259-L09]|nr:hypothetical protein [Acidobacteria bacterium AH-259-L09]
MKRRTVFVNILILAGIVIFAERLTSAWENFQQAHNLQQIVSRAQREGTTVGQLGVEPIQRVQTFADFMVIFEKNLFREDRRPEESVETSGEAAEKQPELPKWAARPIVHGVSAVRGKRQAIVTVFEGKQSKGELRTVKVGDLVQGYTVAGIGDTVVKLRWNDREEVIDMADAAQPAAAGQRATAAVTVITVGSPPKAVGVTAAAATSQEARGIEVGVVQGRSAQARGSQAGRGQGNLADSPSGARTPAGRGQSGLSPAGRGQSGLSSAVGSRVGSPQAARGGRRPPRR